MFRFKDLFKHPSAEEIAARQLEEAKLGLLTAARNKEYWQAQEQFNRSTIERLSKQQSTLREAA